MAIAAASGLSPLLLAQTRADLPIADRAQRPAARGTEAPRPREGAHVARPQTETSLRFEENRGQADPRVRFVSRGRGYTLFLTDAEAVLALQRTPSASRPQPFSKRQDARRNPAVLRMALAGANEPAAIAGEELLPGPVYFATRQQRGALQGIPAYQRVTYSRVYPGIDLQYYGNDRQLEFDFVVAPHADPRRIRLTFSGADRVALTGQGELSLRVGGEEVRLKKPVIHQERDGRRREIPGGYVLSGKGRRDVEFRIGAYDRSRPLVIDPQIDFATYLGGTGADQLVDLRVIPTGEIFLLGSTPPATAFPGTPMSVSGLGSTDCFVSKLSPDGSTLLYSVVFPGVWCPAMAVDIFGNVHLGLFEGGVGSFLRTLKEGPTGVLSVSPLQGQFDFNLASPEQMQVDSAGNVYMVLYYYPLNSARPEYGLFKVDSTGQLVGVSTLLVPTFIPNPGGGEFQQDQITGLAIDDAGHAYAIGGVSSAGSITPTNAFQPIAPGNCTPFTWCDGIVLGIDTNAPGFPVTYASYLGGSGVDYLGDITVGFDGSLYITGQTNSVDFPTTLGPYSCPSSCPGPGFITSGFITRLDLTQSGPQQLTLGAVLPGFSLGGSAIEVLPGGLPAMLSAQSISFPGVNPLYAPPTNECCPSSIVVLSPAGTSLVFASNLAPDTDFPSTGIRRMAAYGSGTLYVAGETADARLSRAGAYQTGVAGETDAFVEAISGIATNRAPVVDLGSTITVSNPTFTLVCGNTITCDISDLDGDSLVHYRWIGPNGFTATSTTAPPVANTVLHAGANRFSLVVTDDQGAVGVGSLTIIVTDTDPPTVVPPADLLEHTTEATGARADASPALHAFLFSTASATDSIDPNPTSLPPQADFGAGPVDVDDQTLFPLGSTAVTFRFRDASGNVGFAIATVWVTENQAPAIAINSSPLPAFLNPIAATSPAGANVVIYAYSTDAESDSLNITWSGLTPGFAVMPAVDGWSQVSGVLPIGQHTITATVSDGRGGSVSASIEITVSGINTIGPQTVGLFDDNQRHVFFSGYWPGNPMAGPLVTLTFSNVAAPGLSYFTSRSDLDPPPPPGFQAGSPPYYYDIATTAGFSGSIHVCIATRGMSLADPAGTRLYQLENGAWTALTSSLTSATQTCGSTASLGTFALFYPAVAETAITTIAGTGVGANSIDGPGGDPRDDDSMSGPGTSTPLSLPRFGAIDRAGNSLYFSDGSLRIRRLDLVSGNLSVVMGNGQAVGTIDGPGGNPLDDFVEGADPLASPGQPFQIALDPSGNLYYQDWNSCQVRYLDFSANTVTTIAGNGTCGYSGDGGPATQASLGTFFGGLSVDHAGNLFVADWETWRIRRVDMATGTITTVAGTGALGTITSGVAATLSAIGSPASMAFDAQRHLLVANAWGVVFRISPGADTLITGAGDEIVTIVAGRQQIVNSPPFTGDGGAATLAVLEATDVSVAHDGALIVVESHGHRVRRVSPGADGTVTGAPDESITTIAGYEYAFNGHGIFNGDTYATMSTLAFPQAAFEDAQGRIIVLDSNNQRIRRFGLSPALDGGVGNRPPVANAGPDQTVAATSAAGATVTLDGSGSFDPDPGDLADCTWTGPFGTLTTCIVSATLPVGTHTITLTVSDGAASATDTMTVIVTPVVDLSVIAAGSPDPVLTGSDLTWSIVVTNNGPSAATAVTLDHTVPASAGFVSIGVHTGICTTPGAGSSGAITCDLGTLGAGATTTVTTVVRPTAAGTLTGEFTISTGELDSNRVNNVATAVVTVNQAPAFIEVVEQIAVSDAEAVLPSAMLAINESISVTDAVTPLPSAMIGVDERITVADSAVPLPSAMIGVAEDISVSDSSAVSIPVVRLSVAKVGEGSGAVTSVPAGIDCGPTCAMAFAVGSTVTLTAVPSAGSVFTGWSGATCGAVRASCSITMTQADSVVATFTLRSSAPSGAFATRVDYQARGLPTGIALADLRRGGGFDLIVAHTGEYSGAISVFASNGDGTFGDRTEYPVPFRGATDVAVGDLRGIGILDLVAGTNGTLSVFLGNGDGTFGPRRDHAASVAERGLALADVSGDGNLDALALDDPAGALQVFLGAGDGTFAAPRSYALGPYPSGIALTDLNRDGHLDVVAGTWRGVLVINVLLNQGDGSFGPRIDVPLGWDVFMTALTVGDLNGDGMSDVVVVGMEQRLSERVFTVLLGRGDGTFVPRGLYSAGSFPVDAKLADLNGDGVLDLITANPYDIATATDTIMVRFGVGDGTFGPNITYQHGAAPWVLAVGDVSGDGRLDVVSANNYDSVSVLLGTAPTLAVTQAGSGAGTITSDPGGIDCAPTCSVPVNAGARVTLTATPGRDSVFTGWSGGGCSGTGTCTVPVWESTTVTATFGPAPLPLVVTKAGAGEGIVTSTPEGIDCGATCSALLPAGSEMTLRAHPGAGSTFAGWSGACSGTGECNLVVDAATNVTATFTIQSVALSVAKSGNGAGTVSTSPAGIDCGLACDASFDYGTIVTLTAMPSTGSTFTGWTGACTGVGPCVVTMDGARSVGAEFTLQSFTLSVTKTGAGAGAVVSLPIGIVCGGTCSSSFEYGTSLTLYATASPGSIFAGWTGECRGTEPCELTIEGAASVGAVFALAPPDLVAEKELFDQFLGGWRNDDWDTLPVRVGNGGIVRFRMTVRNVGEGPANRAISITDALPAGLTVHGGITLTRLAPGVTQLGVGCVVFPPGSLSSSDYVACELGGSLAPGDWVAYESDARVGSSVAGTGASVSLDNRAGVFTEDDGNWSNNSSLPVTLTVDGPAAVLLPDDGLMVATVPASQSILGLVVSPSTPPPPPGVTFPFGTIAYTVRLPVGENTSTVTLTFTPPLPERRFVLFKTGEGGAILGTIPACDETTIVDDCWTRPDTATITLKLTDNGPFDLNPAVRVLEDPVVLGVIANRPPAADPGADQLVEATGPGGALVTLHGSGTDSDGDVLSFAWSGPCGTASAADATFACPLGTSTMTLTVSDGHDGVASASVQITVRDTTPPTIACASPDAAWSATDVGIACSASDAASGLVDPADRSFTLSTRVPAGTETAVASTDTRVVCDVAGNCTTAGSIGPIKVDKKAPEISIGTPDDGAVVILNQSVAASYSCADAGSGLAGCTGTVAGGAALGAASVGTKSFTVTASDAAGNSTSLTHAYRVVFAGEGPCEGAAGHAILPPVAQGGSAVFRQGRTVSAKFRVCDADGRSVGTPGVVSSFRLTQIVSGTATEEVIADVPSTTPDASFRWDPVERQWIFNINTSGFSPGRTYHFTVTLSDATEVRFGFGLR